MKRILAIILLALFGLAPFLFAAEVRKAQIEKPKGPTFVGYVPDKIVVKFAPQTMAMGRLGIPDLDHLGALHGVMSVIPQFRGAKKPSAGVRGVDLTGWHEVRFQREVDVKAVVAAYKAALIWSQNPSWSADEVKAKLFASADNLDSLNPTYAGQLGHGRINAYNAVSGGTPQPQNTVGVDPDLVTGKYSGRRIKTFTETSDFSPGDSVVIKAHVADNAGKSVAGATVSFAITGPVDVNLNGTSDTSGVAEVTWKTRASRRKRPGTPTGSHIVTVTMVTLAGYDWDGKKAATSFSLQ